MTYNQNEPRVPKGRRDAGRWTKTGMGASTDPNTFGKLVDKINLDYPKPELPPLPAEVVKLTKRLYAAPYFGRLGEERRTKAIKRTKQEIQGSLDHIEALAHATDYTPADLLSYLQLDLGGDMAYIDSDAYIAKYGTKPEDDIKKVIDLVVQKFGTEKARAALAAAEEKEVKANFPRNSRRTAVAYLPSAVSAAMGQYSLVNRILEWTPGKEILPYNLAQDAYDNFINAPVGSTAWEKKTLTKWRKDIAGRTFTDFRTDEERMAGMAEVLHKWSQERDDTFRKYRDAYRKRYVGIERAAEKAFRDSGTNTASDWLAKLRRDPAYEFSADSFMVYPDHSRYADNFRAGVENLPLGIKVRRRASDRTLHLEQGAQDPTNKTYRANYTGSDSIIHFDPTDGPDIYAHEFGHHLEKILNLTPVMAQWVIDRAHYKAIPLGKEYGGNEVAYPDTFINKYVGKDYFGEASEVMSMGIQALLIEPDLFKETDKHHFFLTMGVLLGLGDVDGKEQERGLSKSQTAMSPQAFRLKEVVSAIGKRFFAVLTKADEATPPPAATGDAPQPKKEHGPIPEGARWITVHGHGKDAEGHPILIMPATGRKNVWHVIGGAGGKLNHLELHLRSPEEWAQHSKERAQARKVKEKESGVTPAGKEAIRTAKQDASRLFVHRVAEQMGWKDYSDKTADDFLAQANGNKAQAGILASQYLRSYVTKANEAVKGLRTRLTIDQHALAGAHLHVNTDTDPYSADDNDLVAGDISQRLAESQKLGNQQAADSYQQALDAMGRGDTEAAKTYLTAGNKAAGVRSLTIQDLLPKESVAQPGGGDTVTKQAKQNIENAGVLAPDALVKRQEEVAKLAQSEDEIDQYTGKLESEALDKAASSAGGDPAHTDITKAATYYLQAEKFRALREKFKADPDAFGMWKSMREQAIANAAGVRAAKAQGRFGAADVDPDVQDMALAQNLLAAKVLYDNRISRLNSAARTLDPNEIASSVNEQDIRETDADWDKVYDEATQKALDQIRQSQDSQTAAELATSIDDPTAFLQGVGEGEPLDQQHIKRYIDFGRRSAAQLIGEVVGGQEMLPATAYDAMGVKAASKLLAGYIASHRTPEEFNAIRDGIANYHTGREFDVANGALVAAKNVLDSAKEFKREEDGNVDNLYEAAKYNKLRMEAVDHALATLGSAYGELNATAELNYALMSAKPGDQTLAIDGGDRDPVQMVALAHALNLEPEDYTLTSQTKDEQGRVTKPRGLALTEQGVAKLFHEASPDDKARRAKLMDIRAGKYDDLDDSGKRTTEGWLPAYFSRWPTALQNMPSDAPSAPQSDGDVSQVLGDPHALQKAVGYALGKQPFATVGFKSYDALTPDDFKLLRAYYALKSGQKPPQEPEDDGKPNSDQATDIFGNPLMSQAVVGSGNDKVTKAWQDFVHRVGAKNAVQTVQDAIKGEFLDSFAPIYSSISGTKLATVERPMPGGKSVRVGIGQQAEGQLGSVIDKLAWRYPNGQGASEYQIPGMNMSGKYVKQQRAIRSLEESGGLGDSEGGRLGGFLGTGSGKTNVSIGAFTNLLSKGKVRGGLFAVPSAVEGQFGPAIAGVIDPEAPLKWHVQPGERSAGRMKAMADKNTHIVTMTHEALRDDTTKSLAKLWNVTPKEAAKQFMALPRKKRAAVVKQAFGAMGWDHRLDYFSVDEGHQALNRKGKKDALLANVMDAISDNSKYYLPLTGTPVKNDPSEVFDWLTKLRPDQYPPEKMAAFLGRHQLLTSETARLNQTRAEDAADGKPGRDWTTNAAAEALQNELGGNFFSAAAPIKIPVTYKTQKIDLADKPDDTSTPSDGTLSGFIKSGMQKSAYDRVGKLEQQAKSAAMNGDWKSVAEAIRELTTSDYRGKGGKTVTRNAFMDKQGNAPTPGSPEETAMSTKLVKTVAMMRDGAYNRILNAMPNGNAKIHALTDILDQMSSQDAADDNQPKGMKPDAPKQKGKPVIVFTHSLDGVDNIVKALSDRGYKVAGISGRDNGANKLRKKELFQPSGEGKPQVNVLVMSDAMSAGIDLPRAEAVIHMDTPDTAKTQEQRSARAIRLSTKHPVSVYSLVSNTPYEARRVERVQRKGALGDVVQNPAEVLDDSGLAKSINDARITNSRRQSELAPSKGNDGTDDTPVAN